MNNYQEWYDEKALELDKLLFSYLKDKTMNLEAMRKSGIIILTRGKGLASDIIVEGQDLIDHGRKERDVSHCAITSLVDNMYQVVEMVWPRIKKTPLAEWMKVNEKKIVEICEPWHMTINEQIELDKNLKDKLDRKIRYGFWNLFGFLWRPFTNVQKSALECSTMIARSYKEIGRILIPKKNVNTTSPEDILCTVGSTTRSIYKEVMG